MKGIGHHIYAIHGYDDGQKTQTNHFKWIPAKNDDTFTRFGMLLAK